MLVCSDTKVQYAREERRLKIIHIWWLEKSSRWRLNLPTAFILGWLYFLIKIIGRNEDNDKNPAQGIRLPKRRPC